MTTIIVFNHLKSVSVSLQHQHQHIKCQRKVCLRIFWELYTSPSVLGRGVYRHTVYGFVRTVFCCHNIRSQIAVFSSSLWPSYRIRHTRGRGKDHYNKKSKSELLSRIRTLRFKILMGDEDYSLKEK